MISGKGCDMHTLELGKIKTTNTMTSLLCEFGEMFTLLELHWQNGCASVLFVMIKYDK